MGIMFQNDTIFVTGGSQDDPYTMADLDASRGKEAVSA